MQYICIVKLGIEDYSFSFSFLLDKEFSGIIIFSLLCKNNYIYMQKMVHTILVNCFLIVWVIFKSFWLNPYLGNPLKPLHIKFCPRYIFNCQEDSPCIVNNFSFVTEIFIALYWHVLIIYIDNNMIPCNRSIL